MRHLTLSDLSLALDHLVEQRREALLSCAAGRSYLPLLERQRAAVRPLPEALTAGEPFSEALVAVDARHDAYARAIFHMTEAYEKLALVDPELARSARAIRKAFVPQLGMLHAAYADEAEHAVAREPLLEELRPQLERIPVAGGATLDAWVRAMLGEAGKLAELLYERAQKGGVSQGDAARARSGTLALLTRLRGAVRDEVAADTGLAPNLDDDLFGYLDELDLARAGGRAQPPPPPPVSVPPTTQASGQA